MMQCRSILLAALALFLAVPAGAATLQVGPDQQYKKPSEAIAAAKSGDTINIAPGQYYDCAVVPQSDLTIEGTGPGAVMTDLTCMGKALLITNGNNITIRNLTLQRARVPDHNGAGIRAQGGNLTIENVRFLNNEDGILSTNNPAATIRITGSDFEHNGECESGCAHGVYIGMIKLLHVDHTRFFATQIGHSVKSGAATTEVMDCDISDGPDGTSSYLIDAPFGGSLIVQGNHLEKGPKSENHAYAITIGEGGVRQATDKILVQNNTFTNDNEHPTTFVHNLTATAAELVGNTIKGEVRPLEGDGSVH
jgi:hypothetical protein